MVHVASNKHFQITVRSADFKLTTRQYASLGWHRGCGSRASPSSRTWSAIRTELAGVSSERWCIAAQRQSSHYTEKETWAVSSLAVKALTSLLLASTLLVAHAALPGQLPYLEASARARLTAEEQHDIDIFRRARAAVVFITNFAARRDTFTPDVLEIPQGAGSGFCWDSKGRIITNAHVIRGASEVQVTFTDGGDGIKDLKAKVLGVDEDKDLAVLTVDPSELTEDYLQPISLGTSSDLLVGQKVYALGNPFGLDHTLTTGVISGTGREINSGFGGRPIQEVIQIDAAINPGNSGGPLLDSAGDLIGINTAIYSASGVSSGIGFAIPVDTVKSSVEQIILTGKVMRPILGISFAPDQNVEQIGVQGILVLDTKEGGPARRAGIKGTKRDDYGRLVFGDIITAVNGRRTKTASDLYKALDKCKVGEELDIEVLRGQSKEHLKITLESSS